MPRIVVGPNLFAMVDEDDYVRLRGYSWCIAHMNSGYYAVRSVNRKRVYMHHDIIGKPPVGMITDHINGKMLDNRKCNLRHVTYRENRLNSSVVKNATYISISNGRYRARLPINGKKISVGTFNTFEEARQAIEDFRNGL